jgi:phosphoglucan,water dikinase
LTRIRDIAHRNDIPSDLKRELKTSLQNKLHRCAGPEDLVTSAELLKRITAPGAHYPPAFVEQFKIFHEELKEFFNASSLEERLKALLDKAKPEQKQLIQRLLELKSQDKASGRIALQRQIMKARGGDEPSPPLHELDPIALFENLTAVRQSLLRTGESEREAEMQDFLLADIALEDFAFVLLSEILNEMEGAQPKPAASPPAKKQSASKERGSVVRGPAPSFDWRSSLELLSLVLSNLELSQVLPEECHALRGELHAWRQDFDPKAREELLRLKASLERGRRVSEDYSDGILALFPERVEKLGHALGVPEHAVRVYSEAEVRGHLVFQLSKLVSNLLQHIREQLALPAWDVLVTGRQTGRVRVAETLDGTGPEFTESVIVLVKRADGDEEIPKRIGAMVLAHGIPHLSHLGVRARQAGVVLVATDEAAEFEKLSCLHDQVIELNATPEKVEWKNATETRSAQPQLSTPPVRVPEVVLNPSSVWISIEKATVQTAGSKGDGVRQLYALSKQEGADFSVPAALVIPFGVLEGALAAVPVLQKKYQELVRGIDAIPVELLPAITEAIRELIGQIDVPSEIAFEAKKEFGKNVRLMVRSSANCEDLQELAGAGLYDSVANVALENLTTAVRTVWSSLWTRRAVLSRKEARIPQEKAHMAVLVQQMIEPVYSFILHTINPISQSPREVYAEIAVGLGETLASAASRGTPYRLVCDKESGSVTTLAFASFSRGLCSAGNGLEQRTLDYSSIPLSRDSETRIVLGQRLAKIGRSIENALHKPQDIEGAIVGEKIYLVQARPQQGVLGAAA